MATNEPNPSATAACEVCGFTLPPGVGGDQRCRLTGCGKCGRMFGPCCNSVVEDLCAECAV